MSRYNLRLLLWQHFTDNTGGLTEALTLYNNKVSVFVSRKCLLDIVGEKPSTQIPQNQRTVHSDILHIISLSWNYPSSLSSNVKCPAMCAFKMRVLYVHDLWCYLMCVYKKDILCESVFERYSMCGVVYASVCVSICLCVSVNTLVVGHTQIQQHISP